MVNKYEHPISTSHGINYSQNGKSFPTPVAGHQGGGVLQPGQADWIAVPQGWAGNIPIVEYGGPRKIVGDESKIEASFVYQASNHDATFDVNISYV